MAITAERSRTKPGAVRVPWSRRRSRLAKRVGRKVVSHGLLIVLGLLFIFPLIWMILTSLKTLTQAVAFPPILVPHPIVWSNYVKALASEPFGRYFLNTIFYGVATVVGVCLSSSLVAYGFSRLRWPGRDILFYIMVATMLLPFIVTMIPLFVLYKELGWVGSYKPLIIPTFFGSSVFSTFLLRQFFMTIPESLSDAARVDGAGEFYIYSRIILPLAKPAMAVVALFQFIYCWNDFLGPLIYVNNPGSYPLSLGLNGMIGTYSTNWAWLMAAAAAATLPMAVLFFLAQRTFIQGITLTGMKE